MPIKPKRISFTPHTPDPDGICAAQQAAGAGALTLNGADVSDGVASFAADGDYPRVGYQVGITVAVANLSGVNFTITGTDPEGNALSETLAGPNNNTVETTAYFRTVTSITVDGVVGTDVTIGTVDEFATAPIVLDLYCAQVAIAVDISGTINYDVQKAYERLTAGQSPNWIVIGTPDFDDQTADTAGTISETIGALRIIGNSFTGGATIAMNVSQPRYN
jgi:hypothetical protein